MNFISSYGLKLHFLEVQMYKQGREKNQAGLFLEEEESTQFRRRCLHTWIRKSCYYVKTCQNSPHQVTVPFTSKENKSPSV